MIINCFTKYYEGISFHMLAICKKNENIDWILKLVATIVGCSVVSVLIFLLVFLLCGFSKTYINRMLSGLIGQISVMGTFLALIYNSQRCISFLGKHSFLFNLSIYVIIQIVLAYPTWYILYYFIKFFFLSEDGNIDVAITFH